VEQPSRAAARPPPRSSRRKRQAGTGPPRRRSRFRYVTGVKSAAGWLAAFVIDVGLHFSRLLLPEPSCSVSTAHRSHLYHYRFRVLWLLLAVRSHAFVVVHTVVAVGFVLVFVSLVAVDGGVLDGSSTLGPLSSSCEFSSLLPADTLPALPLLCPLPLPLPLPPPPPLPLLQAFSVLVFVQESSWMWSIVVVLTSSSSCSSSSPLLCPCPRLRLPLRPARPLPLRPPPPLPQAFCVLLLLLHCRRLFSLRFLVHLASMTSPVSLVNESSRTFWNVLIDRYKIA